MLKKSIFFDFLNRRDGTDFNRFMVDSIEDEHYINWNQFVLPNDYGDSESEYLAIRNSCALFDVSPLRKIQVRGSGAGEFFDRLLTRPVSDLPIMRATYTVFCNQDGTFKDDAILYKYADDDYMLMPSDVDHSPYFESVCQQFALGNVAFTECTDSWVGMAVQGPGSAAALLEMGFGDVEQLRPFEVRDYELAGSNLRIARMGFTADLGYECWLDPILSEAFIQRIQSARSSLGIELPGYGLDALQACRLEGGFIVAGWDCSTELDPQPGFERTPYELGLGWLVNLEAGDFVGRDALLEHKELGQRYFLRSFTLDRNLRPDDGTEIYAGPDDGDPAVGMVNCSSWSWGLEKIIGNASIESGYRDSEYGWISIDGKRLKAKLARGPLIALERRNQVPAPVDG